MSEDGTYQRLCAGILNEQRAREEDARVKAQTQHRERVESGQRAQNWWQTKMAPEISQAGHELSSLGVTISVETDERQLNLGIFKGALTLSKHSTRYYPYVFVIQGDEITVYRDFSTSTRVGAVSVPPRAIDELSGFIDDEAYAGRVIPTIIETALRGH